MNSDKLRILLATTSWLWFLLALLVKKHIRREPNYIQWVWRTEVLLLPIVSIISITQLAFSVKHTSLDMVTLVIYLFAVNLFSMTCFYILGRMIIEACFRGKETPTPIPASTTISPLTEIQISNHYVDL